LGVDLLGGAFLRKAKVIFGALFGAVFSLVATQALAMNWVRYAPDADGYSYWLDKDTISTGGGYTYAYFVWLAPGSAAPTSTASPVIGVVCETGESIKLTADGKWVPGNHFDKRAFLFNALCPAK
jgi:hypothetical protein